MPISCPKCGVLSPSGAETCGECGWTLDSSPLFSPEKVTKPSTSTSQSSTAHKNSSETAGKENKGVHREESKNLSGASILSKKEKKKAPVFVQILSGILWVLSAAMIAFSIFLVKPGKSLTLPVSFLPIPLLSPDLPHRSRIFLALLVLASGIYTLITAYGISNLKKWAIKVYTTWVMIQVVLEILARMYHLQYGVNFSIVVLVELIFILLLWRVNNQFLY
ncbi:MAG: zinc ribbon domain-containing protein [bacterium]